MRTRIALAAGAALLLAACGDGDTLNGRASVGRVWPCAIVIGPSSGEVGNGYFVADLRGCDPETGVARGAPGAAEAIGEGL